MSSCKYSDFIPRHRLDSGQPEHSAQPGTKRGERERQRERETDRERERETERERERERERETK
eukprot:COSAG03_NODE_19995_length_326_cov_0.898678_1_plen_62_part_10